jgi:hypothetical protein
MRIGVATSASRTALVPIKTFQRRFTQLRGKH